MIRVFFGDDRVKALEEVSKIFGKDYEVFDGENLASSDIANILSGTSLFEAERKILLRDLTANQDNAEIFLNLLPSATSDIILLETKLDKRSVFHKSLQKEKLIELKEFKAQEERDFTLFNIVDMALNNRKKEALNYVESNKFKNDPYMFVGALTFQILKIAENRDTKQIRKAIKNLGELDILLKTSTTEPWGAIKTWLIAI